MLRSLIPRDVGNFCDTSSLVSKLASIHGRMRTTLGTQFAHAGMVNLVLRILLVVVATDALGGAAATNHQPSHWECWHPSWSRLCDPRMPPRYLKKGDEAPRVNPSPLDAIATLPEGRNVLYKKEGRSVRVQTAILPPHIGMVSDFGVLPWRPGEFVHWPMVTRHVETQLTVRAWRFASAVTKSEDLIALRQYVESRGQIVNGVPIPEPVLHRRAQALGREPFVESAALLTHLVGPVPLPQDIVVHPAQGEASITQLPLSGYSMVLLEADSPIVRAFETEERARWERCYPRRGFSVDFGGTVVSIWDHELDAIGPTALRKAQALWAAFPARDWPTVGVHNSPLATAKQVQTFQTELRARGFRASTCISEFVATPYTLSRHQRTTPDALSSRLSVVQLSNLNVSVGEPGLDGRPMMRVTSFDRDSPVADASVEFWSADLRLLATERTDWDGVPYNEGGDLGKTAWIVIRAGEDATVVPFRPYVSRMDDVMDEPAVTDTGWLPGESVFGRWAPVSARKLPDPYWLPPVTFVPIIEIEMPAVENPVVYDRGSAAQVPDHSSAQ